ncbi:MAG: alginate export family protein [Bryobacteraceae bacterium]
MSNSRQLCGLLVAGVLLFAFPTLGICADVSDAHALLDEKPSDAANEHLPSWLKVGGELRFRFEEFAPRSYRAGEDSYLLNRTRFDLTIQPAKWFVIFGQAQDARAFFQNVLEPVPPAQNTWDLRQAYVRLGAHDDGPIALTVGRQEINLGEERLVGSSNWTNTARTFDAVRLRMHGGGFRLDMFSASVVDQRVGGFDHHTQGNNLHGLYGGLDKIIPRGTIEPYVLWRLAPSRIGPSQESGARAKLNEKTFGFRSKGKLGEGFDYNIEMAKQIGRSGTDRISAWAGHWLVGKTMPSLRATPRFVTEYNFASGDENPNDGLRGTFDQIYPTAHGKYGYSDQVGWRNIHDAHIALELNLNKRMSVSTGFHEYWLASRFDGLYNTGNALVARSLTGTAGRHVGSDFDLTGTYSVSQAIKLAVGCGHLFPGQFLKTTIPGQSFTYPYVMVTWTL